MKTLYDLKKGDKFIFLSSPSWARTVWQFSHRCCFTGKYMCFVADENRPKWTQPDLTPFTEIVEEKIETIT